MPAIELTLYETLELVYSSLITIAHATEECDGYREGRGKKLAELWEAMQEIRTLSTRAISLIEAHDPNVVRRANKETAQ